MLNKIKSTARSIAALQKILSSKIIFQVLKKNLATEFAGDLKFDRVLVLSAHPDDEVIGSAGAIIKLIADQGKVKVIHFTDGSEGFAEDSKPNQTQKKEMAKTRESEARKVQEYLGIADIVFLGYKDGKLAPSKSLINYIRQTILDHKPDAIFIPSLLDPNSDHNEVTRSFYLATRVMQINPEVFQYEVWSPVYANYYLNIDSIMDKKISAIKLYKSQLQSRDYAQAIEGLNRYRGTIYGKSKYAECYLKTDLKTFKYLAELIY